MLDWLNLAEVMVRTGFRYSGMGRAGGRKAVMAEARGLSLAEAHRRVIQGALPTAAFMTPVTVALGFALGWITGEIARLPGVEFVVGLGIAFAPGATFFVLNAFLWILRLRGQNVLVKLLAGSCGGALWRVSLSGYLLASIGAGILYVFDPDLVVF